MAPRFFHPEPLSVGARAELSPTAATHARTVLRLRAGAEITLFDGHGAEFHAVITQIDRGRLRVDITRREAVDRESSLPLTLVQGLIKGQKMDWIVQKATELGVTAIHPVVCERSVVRLPAERLIGKANHWRGVAIAACEQCGRNRLPLIHDPIPLAAAIAAAAPDHRRWIMHPGLRQPRRRQTASPADRAILYCGPEGGFTDHEVAQLRDQGALTLWLGQRTLRSDTAALTGIVLLQQRCGDLGAPAVDPGDWRAPTC